MTVRSLCWSYACALLLACGTMNLTGAPLLGASEPAQRESAHTRPKPSDDPEQLRAACQQLLRSPDRLDRVWAAYWIAEARLNGCELDLQHALTAILVLPDENHINSSLEADYLLDALARSGGHTTFEQARVSNRYLVVALWAESPTATAAELRSVLANRPRHRTVTAAHIALLNRLAAIDPQGTVAEVLQARSLTVAVTLRSSNDPNQFMAIGAGGGAAGAFGARPPSGWPPQRESSAVIITADDYASLQPTTRLSSPGPLALAITRTRASQIAAHDDAAPIIMRHRHNDNLKRYRERLIAWLANDISPLPPVSTNLSHTWQTAEALAQVIDTTVDTLRQPWRARLDRLIDAGLLDGSDTGLLADTPVVIKITDIRSNPAAVELPISAIGVEIDWHIGRL